MKPGIEQEGEHRGGAPVNESISKRSSVPIRLIRYWINRLSDKKLIDAQIMFYVFVSHTHHAFKCYYHGAKGSPGEYLSRDFPASQKADTAASRQERQRRETSLKVTLEADQDWDWRGVPEWCPLVRLYGYCSLFWMTYALIKGISGVYGDQVHMEPIKEYWLLMGVPINCILLGRFMFQPTMESHCSRIFASMHLAWRYVQRYKSRSYMLAPFTFLLQTDRDLDKFYRIMQENKHNNYLTDSSPHATLVGEPVMGPQSRFMRRFSNFREQITNQQNQQRYSLTQQMHQLDAKQRQKIETEQGVSVHESFFRHIMCYEVHINDKIYYKLRPNRSLQSRNTLKYHLAASTLLCSSVSTVLMIIITICTCAFPFSNANYARLYPGCVPDTSLKDEIYQGPYRDWFWFKHLNAFLRCETHRFLAILFDFVETFIIWIDSVFAITYVSIMAHLLNYDTLIYWRGLHTKLEKIVTHLKYIRYKNHYSHQLDKKSLSTSQFAAAAAEAAVTMWKSTSKSRLGDEIVTNVRTIRIRHYSEAQLESEINDFQFELIDFFSQVEKADKIISDILTHTLIIWIFNVTYISYHWNRSRAEIPVTVTAVFAVGLIVLTVASKYLLELNRCCMKSYKLICTLMAYDQASSKERFIKLLEFYNHRNRTTYTLFQRYPYKGTTYISMAGWSLSCYFIVSSLFYNRGLIK